MVIRTASKEEKMFTCRQSSQIASQTCNIGYLRGDFGSAGTEFYSSWFDITKCLNTDDFSKDFDDVVNTLREPDRLLHDMKSMKKFICDNEPEKSKVVGGRGEQYAFRVDTDDYAYLIRCSITRGDYNFFIFCYQRKWLDRLIDEAKGGIRFIDSSYKELFRIEDGGEIVIKRPDGEEITETCRYIDSCHIEIGPNIFHICEFAERMEAIGATYAPYKKEGR